MLFVLTFETTTRSPCVITRKLYNFFVRVITVPISPYWLHVVDDPRLVRLRDVREVINQSTQVVSIGFDWINRGAKNKLNRATQALRGTLNKSNSGGGSDSKG